MNDKKTNLEKFQIQTDQNSDMNVIAKTFAQKMKLKLRFLLEMKFNKISIKYTNNHKILLHY